MSLFDTCICRCSFITERAGGEASSSKDSKEWNSGLVKGLNMECLAFFVHDDLLTLGFEGYTNSHEWTHVLAVGGHTWCKAGKAEKAKLAKAQCLRLFFWRKSLSRRRYEIRDRKAAQRPKGAQWQPLEFGFSDLFYLSDFSFRISGSSHHPPIDPRLSTRSAAQPRA